MENKIIHAAKVGNVENVRELLVGGAEVNAKDPDGWTALISACREGHSKVVKELLEAGADVQVKDKNGWTPLMWLRRAQQHNRMLIEKGAERGEDQYGASALMKASRGFEDEAKLLLKKGPTSMQRTIRLERS
jgi:ankyrin repeat protein